MKKIRLSVELTYSGTEELEVSDEEYERIKEKGILSLTLLSEVDKLTKKALDKTNCCLDYKVEDVDNDITIIDWDR
jgi:hypothetical protein